ncbi:Oidioi.mRNA.OKI2018_I69.chr1.g720.t1.cds [Oikopleura dioica]|uniref:Oidioi.mRNA.OKI2018_I69.chr1.g720.t1.cds n=1 Tax=Oikopleura dioica TaxID=34765 RepID=A0ABN7SKQ7_OIKDI|nr:Oidioi.mRNA.OKI2018_I69.chr1.g720.t1.cds [Oikopleura dioica]
MSFALTENFSNNELFSYPFLRVNESCIDLDLGELCATDCVDETLECLKFCEPDDDVCGSLCIRDGFHCIDGCPCHIECPEGCLNCPADICNPQPPQKLGAVLLLRRDPDYVRIPDVPILASFDTYTEDLKISWFNNGPYNREFFAEEGCSVVFKGRNYLFGGWFALENGKKEYGPHILDECDIVKSSGAEFHHNCALGAVGYFPEGDDLEANIMIYDGDFTVKGPILISGWDSTNRLNIDKVEIFNDHNSWIADDELIFPDKFITDYTSVWGEFGIVVFPGSSGSNVKIWRLYNNEWTTIGLTRWTERPWARAVLFPNNEIMLVGGNEAKAHKFTKFTFNEDFTHITARTLRHPALYNWDDPHAILVPEGFCTL